MQPPLQEADQSWLLRNMLAVSDCVCFAGRLTECQGSRGAAVWMAGQHGSARVNGLAELKEARSLPWWAVLPDLSSPLLSIQNQPWYCFTLRWSWRTREWEEILVSSKSTAKWSWIGKCGITDNEMWQQVKSLIWTEYYIIILYQY